MLNVGMAPYKTIKRRESMGIMVDSSIGCEEFIRGVQNYLNLA